MVVLGSSEKKICAEACSLVARAFPSSRKNKRVRGEVRDDRDGLSVIPSSAYIQAQVDEAVETDRPWLQLADPGQDRVDFDDELLPEDSWVPDLGLDEYDVEKISDMRSGRRPIYGRILHEFLAHWKGMKIQHGSTGRISTVGRFNMNSCEITWFVTDST